MGVDNFIDFGHDANGFGEGDDDFVVVVDDFIGEDADFADLLPFSIESKQGTNFEIASGDIDFLR